MSFLDEEYLNNYSYSSPDYNVPRIKSRKMHPRKIDHIKAVENLLKHEKFVNNPNETDRINKNNSGNTTTQLTNEKKTTSNVVMTVTTTHLWCILFIMIVVLTIMNVITLRNIKEIVKNIQSTEK